MDRDAWIDLRERPPTEADGELVLVWHVYQGTMVVERENVHSNRFFSHWRPVPVDGWIDAKDHGPTAQDGDVWRCILIRHEIYGFKVTGWHQVEPDKFCTHWMHTPGPPPNHVELQKMY